MTRADDEDWSDDPLVRALRAPGTPAELSGEAQFVAAYRAQRSRGSVGRGRLAGRFGLGATTVVTTIALTGGMAAAYTNTLPDPVQRFAHEVLGPVGVPAAPPQRPSAKKPEPAEEPVAEVEPSAKPTESPEPSDPRSPEPSRAPTSTVSGLPVPGQVPVVPPVTAPPSQAVTPSPSPRPRRVAVALSASASSSKVQAGASVSVSGVLTDVEGVPLRNRAVRLLERTGSLPWARVAEGRTDREGRISLQSGVLTQNTRFRLVANNQVRSEVVPVVVVPVLTASAADEDGTTTIRVTAVGGRAGDRIVAYRRAGNRLVEIGRSRLSADGSASIVVQTPTRSVRVVIRLSDSGAHGRGQTSVKIGPRTRVDPPVPVEDGRVEQAP